MQSALAWIWAPAVLYAISLGLGLLVESATRFRPDPGLTVPLGFALALTMATPLYYFGARATAVALLLAAAAVVGAVLRRNRLRACAWSQPAMWAALAAYGLYLAPCVLSGSWTWAGYNFTNDPANTLTATAWILQHGFNEPARVSTSAIVAQSNIHGGYPLGAHLLLGSVRPLIGVPLEAAYQSFIAFAAAMAAAAMAQICRRVGMPAIWAVVAAVTATGANLLYVYGQLGGVKEIVMVALLATATGIAAQSPPGRWTTGAAVTAVVPLAASVPVYSAGGLIYSTIFGAVAIAFALLDRGRRPLRAVALTGAVAVAVFVVMTAPSLASAVRFGSDVNSGLDVAPLGQLLRPLPLSQIAGVWWGEDWRLPIPPGIRWDLNRLALALVFLAAVVGAIYVIRRRMAGVLVGVLAVVAAIALVGPRTTPYGESKLYIIVSPFIVLIAGLGVWALARRVRPAAIVAGLAIVLAIAYTDAIVYREVRLAPIDRMQAMEDVARAARGHGVVLDYEWEEWAKYFMRSALVNSGIETYWSPDGMPVRKGIALPGNHYDLDEVPLHYITGFSALVSRRAPDASRPPANFHLAYSNRYYELWLRDKRLTVVHHLPIQGLFTSQVKVPCRDVERFASQAEPGDELMAARRATNVVMQPTQVGHSAGWAPSPAIEGTTVPGTPGHAAAATFVAQGTYRVWLYGSSGRPIDAIVDGRKVGQLKQVNTPGGWVQVGQVRLASGRHRLEIRRPGGSLAPGNSYQGRIGPLALEPVARGTVLRVPASRASELCNGPLDWVEIVRPRGRPA
jgi:hypothetical protein